MTLPFKAFVFCFLFFAISVNAQKEIDTLFFVRNAASLYELMPKEGMFITYPDFARDSATFHKNTAGKTLTISITGTHYTGTKAKPFSHGYYRYRFDGENRPEEYSSWSVDSVFLYGYRYYYRISNRPERIIYRTRSKSDTTNYSYDRAGNFAGECTRDSCTQRLYDSKQRVLVMRNVHYGSIKGDFTYEYNDQGKLIRRRFLESQSGVVLCTDTLEYKFVDIEKRYLSKKHSIHIAGREGWIAIDETVTDKMLNKVVSYEEFHGIGGWKKTSYSYNEAGALSSKQINTPDRKTEITYARHLQSDTIREYKIIEEKKEVRKILWAETIFIYDPAGMIVEKKDKSYTIEKVKRKWQVLLYEEKLGTFRWN